MAKKIKVILDTNWYVSATINRNSRRQLYSLLVNSRLQILYSPELLAEYQKVMGREKFRKWVTLYQVERFITLVVVKLTAIKIRTRIEASRDKKDNYLLSIAVDGKADYLVTGDPDLLELNEIGKTKILRMSAFLEAIDKAD